VSNFFVPGIELGLPYDTQIFQLACTGVTSDLIDRASWTGMGDFALYGNYILLWHIVASTCEFSYRFLGVWDLALYGKVVNIKQVSHID